MHLANVAASLESHGAHDGPLAAAIKREVDSFSQDEDTNNANAANTAADEDVIGPTGANLANVDCADVEHMDADAFAFDMFADLRRQHRLSNTDKGDQDQDDFNDNDDGGGNSVPTPLTLRNGGGRSNMQLLRHRHRHADALLTHHHSEQLRQAHQRHQFQQHMRHTVQQQHQQHQHNQLTANLLLARTMAANSLAELSEMKSAAAAAGHVHAAAVAVAAAAAAQHNVGGGNSSPTHSPATPTLAACSVGGSTQTVATATTTAAAISGYLLPCPLCDTPLEPRVFRQHLDRHYPRDSPVCPVLQCGRRFAHPNSVRNHMRIKHTMQWAKMKAMRSSGGPYTGMSDFKL